MTLYRMYLDVYNYFCGCSLVLAINCAIYASYVTLYGHEILYAKIFRTLIFVDACDHAHLKHAHEQS